MKTAFHIKANIIKTDYFSSHLSVWIEIRKEEKQNILSFGPPVLLEIELKIKEKVNRDGDDGKKIIYEWTMQSLRCKNVH